LFPGTISEQVKIFANKRLAGKGEEKLEKSGGEQRKQKNVQEKQAEKAEKQVGNDVKKIRLETLWL
jgi:hypothetical protein